MPSSDMGVETKTNPYGVQNGGTMTYNGTQMNYQNPGQFTASQLNPQAGAYADTLKGLQGQVANSMPGSDYYSHMQQQQGQQINSSLQNQYSAMGLSGSSAAMGAMNQANIQNEQAWTGRQLSDSMHSAQLQGQLNQMGYQDVMGVQNQYGNFEDAYNQSIANLLGAQQQQQQANWQLGGNVFGSLAGAGGMVMGA